ncbi:MAG: cyclic-di-AMP receptor [Tissierellia bacterium]|nr:cyclic-di-AMP receptor [Tissierellia bacterium]
MKLILAIISDELIDEVSEALSDRDFKTTKLSSTGGFLKKGNTTIIIGAEKEKVDDIIYLLKTTIENSDKKNSDQNISDANIFVIPMAGMQKM